MPKEAERMTDTKDMRRSCLTIGDINWAQAHIDAQAVTIIEQRDEIVRCCDKFQAQRDAQDAKIKALVEAGEAMNPRRIGYGQSMCQRSFSEAWAKLEAALAAAKETT